MLSAKHLPYAVMCSGQIVFISVKIDLMCALFFRRPLFALQAFDTPWPLILKYKTIGNEIANIIYSELSPAAPIGGKLVLV